MRSEVHDVAHVKLHVRQIVGRRRRQHPGIDRMHLKHRELKRLPPTSTAIRVRLGVGHAEHVGRHGGRNAVDLLGSKKGHIVEWVNEEQDKGRGRRKWMDKNQE